MAYTCMLYGISGRSLSTKNDLPPWDMQAVARHYIQDRSVLGQTCEINSFSLSGQSRLFVMTDDEHLYPIYDRHTYVRLLSFCYDYKHCVQWISGRF